MLIQMPREPDRKASLQDAAECSPFEAALRRDLASAPVVSYDSTLGGWSKRAIDLALTGFTAPVWILVLLGGAIWARSRHSAPVFEKHVGVGYGCHSFKYYTLRAKPPSAVIEPLRPEATESARRWEELKRQADGSLTKWSRAIERLPQLFNVLRGEMALVGPRPLSPEQLAALRSGKRHYVSARPGVIGIGGVADAQDENASQYKIYAMAWSHETDALIIWDALSGLLDKGELWRPTRRVLKARRDFEQPPQQPTAAE